MKQQVGGPPCDRLTSLVQQRGQGGDRAPQDTRELGVFHLGRLECEIAGPPPQGQSEKGGNEGGETQRAAKAGPAQATRSPKLSVCGEQVRQPWLQVESGVVLRARLLAG